MEEINACAVQLIDREGGTVNPLHIEITSPADVGGGEDHAMPLGTTSISSSVKAPMQTQANGYDRAESGPAEEEEDRYRL